MKLRADEVIALDAAIKILEGVSDTPGEASKLIFLQRETES